MAKPNKTVGNWRKKNPFPPSNRPVCAFVEWLSAKVRSGVQFKSVEDAKSAYKAETGADA